MLKVLLNGLKPQPKHNYLATTCRLQSRGRRVTGRIFKLRILNERYLQHNQDLDYVFVDLKKAFDRVWHKALWSSIGGFINISANLIRVIKNLYNKATAQCSLT